jgi:glycosyltransferase involved in cell wall biosynthesis
VTDPTDLISIVLPVHNQAGHLEQIIDRYVEALTRLSRPYEILLVLNGCTDGSASAAAALVARHDHVAVHELAEPGWGRAVRAGLAVARGDLLCYTNSARTSSEALLLMLFYATAYPNVVLKANRRFRDSWQRRLGGLLYNLEARMLFDLATWDVNGTPKVFPRSFDRLLELRQDDDLIDLEFVALCRNQEYPMLEVPIPRTIRHGGRSTTNYSSALRMYVGATRLARRPDLRR